jgi:hypothetical protein
MFYIQELTKKMNLKFDCPSEDNTHEKDFEKTERSYLAEKLY